MENQQIPDRSSSLDNFFNIAFDESTRAQVRKAAQWARICTLCAFISYGISLIVAFFGKQAELTETETGIQISGTFRAGIIIGSLITVGIGVWINYWLYRFATSAAKGMDTMDSFKTNEGFDGLRRYFKIIGILLIIGLSLAVLIILFNLFR
ncbi:MAG TPA: DUF5362 family protein [Puia sp.]|jgi:hypothetical protein|nr:DUF5362 family protein [Puia sp.]